MAPSGALASYLCSHSIDPYVFCLIPLRALCPLQAKCHHALATETERRRKAVSLYEQVLTQEPNHSEARAGLAVLYRLLGDPLRAAAMAAPLPPLEPDPASVAAAAKKKKAAAARKQKSAEEKSGADGGKDKKEKAKSPKAKKPRAPKKAADGSAPAARRKKTTSKKLSAAEAVELSGARDFNELALDSAAYVSQLTTYFEILLHF